MIPFKSEQLSLVIDLQTTRTILFEVLNVTFHSGGSEKKVTLEHKRCSRFQDRDLEVYEKEERNQESSCSSWDFFEKICMQLGNFFWEAFGNAPNYRLFGFKGRRVGSQKTVEGWDL